MNIVDVFQHLTPFDMDAHTDSFVSGKQQQYIDVQYYHDEFLLKFYAKVVFHKETQGAPGIVHGGAIASVLDETMGGVSFLNNLPAVTANLNVNYFKPLPVEQTMYIISLVERTEGKKVFLVGEMYDEAGMLFANAKGIFVTIPNEKIG